MDKELLIVKTGALNEDARALLREEGWLVIEMDDPHSVRRLPLEVPPILPQSPIVAGLIRALIGSGSSRSQRAALEMMAREIEGQGGSPK